jgi:hypothetical protein
VAAASPPGDSEAGQASAGAARVAIGVGVALALLVLVAAGAFLLLSSRRRDETDALHEMQYDPGPGVDWLHTGELEDDPDSDGMFGPGLWVPDPQAPPGAFVDFNAEEGGMFGVTSPEGWRQGQTHDCGGK